MLYEFTTIELGLRGSNKVQEGLASYMAASPSRGRLLGCWDVDIGVLGRMFVLRGFETAEQLAEERHRLLMDGNPFGAGDAIANFTSESYKRFPIMPDIGPGAYGNVYEFRAYRLRPGGIEKSIAAWRDALPGRQPISPVLITMYGLDAPPRMLHIVAYDSLDARSRQRKELTDKKLWPPKGAPEQIVHAVASIAVPCEISPMR